MNYLRVYSELINSSLQRGLDKNKLHGYFECHHILPRCMGGDNSPDNLVLLTGREHFIAHKLLLKIYPDSRPLLTAVLLMSRAPAALSNGRKVTSTEYGRFRQMFATGQTGEGNPAKCPLVREKMSLARKGRPSSFKGKVMSADSRKKLSDSHKGKHSGENNVMYGTKPWNTGSSIKSEVSQRVWASAKEAYGLFLQGNGHKAIQKALSIKGSNKSSYIKMVEHFRKGWNPYEDEEWLFTFEINPYKDIS